MTAVPVLPPTSGTFNFGVAARLLDTAYYTPAPTRGYDISRDGQKFLMIKDAAAADPKLAAVASIVVVLNWQEELKRLVPTR